MRAVSFFVLVCLLMCAQGAWADGKGDLVQSSVGLGAGAGYTAPDGSAGAGAMARGGFKYLRDGGHLILSIDSSLAIGPGVSSQSWSQGAPPVIGYGDLRAAIGGKTNGADGCGYFALGGGEAGYNRLGVNEARANGFIESGLACNNMLGSQLSLYVGPIAKIQGDFLQQNSSKVLAGGRAELIGRRGNLAIEGVTSVANLSSGPMDAKAQTGITASGEIKVWRGLALGASVAYDYYGYKNGPFVYMMDGVTGMGYVAWHFDKKPAVPVK